MMNARQLMTQHPCVVTPTDDLARAAELMRYEDIGGVPVVDNLQSPKLVGIITDRDITTRYVARSKHTPCTVGEVMTPAPLRTVGLNAGAAEIARLMEEANVRRIPVVTDDGILIGIVAEADLANKLAPDAALPLLKRVKSRSAGPFVRPSAESISGFTR